MVVFTHIIILICSMLTFCYPIIGQRGNLINPSVAYTAFTLSLYCPIPDGVMYEPGGATMEQVIACAPHSLNLSCPRDTKIDVKLGNYGRFTITLCNNQVTTYSIKIDIGII